MSRDGEPASASPRDESLARALASLAHPVRLALLRQLREPLTLGEIRLRPSPGEGGRVLSRQAVREHLDRLLALGVVQRQDGEREFGEAREYLLNHQALFALAEELRGLARLRPTLEPTAPTREGMAGMAAARAEGPCLILVKGLDEGRVFPLRAPEDERRAWVIGRRRGLDVPLDFDPFVSTEHALVVREGETFHVQDLDESRNGTTLNFAPLPKGARRALRTSDLVGVGRSLLMFRA